MNFKKPKFWDNSRLSFWSIILYPISLLLLFLSFISKLIKIEKKFSVPIICVGNIYVGGTGKTPLAKEIFKITKSLGKNPAFVKKYYSYLEDEINMLQENGKTFFLKNRKDSLNSLIKNGHDLAILDDGFQDLSIYKNLNIVCFNQKQWIGNQFVIPAGPLREKLSALRRADCILINGNKDSKIENEIYKANKSSKIFYSKYKALDINRFKEKKVCAFAGIGNPSNFFELLKKNNINVKETISYPDHYNYSEEDYGFLIKKKEQDVLLATTEKDYYRLNEKMKESFDYVDVDLEIDNKNEFINLINSKL